MNDHEVWENEHQMEVENRVRNLMWTVSGNYDLDVQLDIDSFKKSKYISLYDAIKQGAFDRYFDKNELAYYVAKKCYLGADQPNVMELCQCCVDMAVHQKVEEERAGVASMRKRAFDDIMEYGNYRKLTESLAGQIKLTMMRKALDAEYRTQDKLEAAYEILEDLQDASSTMDIIRAADELYNNFFDRSFERKNGGLDDVMKVSREELLEDSGWSEYLKELAIEESFDEYMKRLSEAMTKSQADGEKAEEESPQEASSVKHIVNITEEDLKKIYSYVELNYGQSYMSRLESGRVDYRLCRGAHADCSLYFTEGILKNPVKNNYQYQYALRHLEVNKQFYAYNHNVTRKNISILTDVLNQALIRRNEMEYVRDDHGVVVPNLLWKVGHTDDRRLFTRVINRDNSEFVVDILIDASGSQRIRQSKVALQGYILSRALSNAGLPHRVQSFCTFWDYTIMHRFRDYDDGRAADNNIFEYTTSSNNRDGLAIRAAVDGLMKRPEENKILIVLSDGKPNDIIVNRPNSKNPASYCGEYAVKDTAREVRQARTKGISVLGVFAGREEELNAEKMIFGKDFAYIREIDKFSNVVGTYLKRQLDMGD